MPRKRKHGNVMPRRSRGLRGKRMKRKNDAERRRRALRAFMAAHEISAAQWARDAGLKTPNSLYNFLNGLSDSLASKTLEALARAKGVTVDQLIGDSVAQSKRDIVTISVRGIVEAGRWGEAVELPPDERRVITLTESAHSKTGKTYGLVVRGTSMNRLFPPGTVLECIDLHDFHGELEAGNKVIVHRRDKHGHIEATCKEFQLTEGLAWLWPRSDDPAWQQPISMVWPPLAEDGSTAEGIESVEIKAVVLRSIRSEI